MKHTCYSDVLYLLCKLILCSQILPVFPQCGTQGFPASCKALEVWLCGQFPLLANVVDVFKFAVRALLSLEKRSILLNPSFYCRGFIDFSAFPPDLIIIAIVFFHSSNVCSYK